MDGQAACRRPADHGLEGSAFGLREDEERESTRGGEWRLGGSQTRLITARDAGLAPPRNPISFHRCLSSEPRELERERGESTQESEKIL